MSGYTSFANGDTGAAIRGKINAQFLELMNLVKIGYETLANAAALAALPAAYIAVGKVVNVLDADGNGNARWYVCTNATGPVWGDLAMMLNTGQLTICDATDVTKKVVFDVSTVGTGTSKTITMPNANVNLGALEPTLAKTNLTEATSSILTISNGTGAVIGAAPVTIAIQQATGSVPGYLGSADWTTFNGKKKNWVGVPASASAAGVAGDIAYDSGWLYVCVATSTWVRAALTTWA